MAQYEKKRENRFMKKLLEYSATDLIAIYSRKKNFASGKSLNYCKIGELKFSNAQRVPELQNPESAFRLGVEFGINIGIDAFNAVPSAGIKRAFSTKPLVTKPVKRRLEKNQKGHKQ